MMDGATGVIPGGPAQFRDKTFRLRRLERSRSCGSGATAAPTGNALQHHDWARLGNGDTLILVERRQDAAGFRRPQDDRRRDLPSRSSRQDGVDLARFRPSRPARLLAGPVDAPAAYAGELDYLHLNAMEVLGPNRWAANTAIARFAPDQHHDQLARRQHRRDHRSGQTGAIVWHLGPDYPPRGSDYKPETTPRPVDQIVGQHDPAYDRGRFAGRRRHPPARQPGRGRLPARHDAPHQWLARARDRPGQHTDRLGVSGHTDSGQANWAFWTPFIGSVQRLPNGNTLIDEGIDGRFCSR